MNRAEFEHVIAAAANVLDEEAFIVLGSQAILGSHPDAPAEMLRSMDVDIYPRDEPSRAIEIDGNLGDGSAFQQTYGYYAHGVGPETLKAPEGWEGRLIAVKIPGRTASKLSPVAYCLEPHDLVAAKCGAGRPQDWDFARVAVNEGLVKLKTVLKRVTTLPVDKVHRKTIATQLQALKR